MVVLRKLKNSLTAMVDLNVVLVIGLAFAGMMVLSYIIYEIRDSLAALPGQHNGSNLTIANITTGYADSINLILVAVTIMVLAIAISSLFLLRGR